MPAAVIVKQGIRIAHKEFVANEERQELAVVRRLAHKRAGGQELLAAAAGGAGEGGEGAAESAA
jgi:hypothetical protein